MKNQKVSRPAPITFPAPRNVRISGALSEAANRFAIWFVVAAAGCCGIAIPVLLVDPPRFEIGIAFMFVMALAAATGITEATKAWRDMGVATGKLDRREDVLAEFRARH